MFIRRQIVVSGQAYQVDVPDACPACHRHSEVSLSVADRVEDNKGVQAVFRCAYQACRVFFICSYGPVPSPDLLAVRPLKPPENKFPEAISKLSPTFVSVFGEANEAKHLGLKQVAGPGYRKAFEFLIKDYAKSREPSKEEEIKGKLAGAVVADFIPDTRIQAVAKRCLWLGNDETHYMRKWADHDIEDLVTLIKLTTNWIEIEDLSKAYIQDMPEKGPSVKN
jgi:hypothetical protein